MTFIWESMRDLNNNTYEQLSVVDNVIELDSLFCEDEIQGGK